MLRFLTSFCIFKHFCLGGFCLTLSCFQIWAQNEAGIDQSYEEAKLNYLCKSVQLILMQEQKSDLNALSCLSLENLQASLPVGADQAIYFFKLFQRKTYKSYGKNKLEARLNKLIIDIETELLKLYRGQAWEEDVQVLMIELNSLREDRLAGRISGAVSEPSPEATLDVSAQSEPNPQSKKYMPIVYFILLILAGGIGFLIWQNQQLKQQLLEIEDQFQERYSRLDNRLDTTTPVKDYQSLLLKFNFLNDQLNALVQEIVVLKNRNQYKITAEEIYAQRTEHLESYTFNPEVQIYYGKFRPDQGGFTPQEFKTEPSRDSIYKIEINLEDPDQAIFGIVNRSEYHQVALANADRMLAPACEYANEPYNDSRIITLEKGLLEQKEGRWVILKRAKISFE